MELVQILQTLIPAYGPSGDEADVRQKITDFVQPYVDEITTDVMGNLIAHKKGSGAKVMLCAHMDTVGFIVTHIEQDGFLRVGRLGGVIPKEAAFAPVRFKNGTCGVFLPGGNAEFDNLTIDNCFIDIGAKTTREAQALVKVGDTAVYDGNCRIQGSRIFSPYLDNRISCAVLLKTIEGFAESPNDLYFVFSTQEELGMRGAKSAAFGIAPDVALVVDVTGAYNFPGAAKKGSAQLGKGAAIKVMDTSVICHPDLVTKLTQLAQENDIPAQQDVLTKGGTDGGPISQSGLGVKTGGVSIPCQHIHAPTEIIDLSDADACVRLITAFVKSVV